MAANLRWRLTWRPSPRSPASLRSPSPASSPFGSSVPLFSGAYAGSAVRKKTVEEVMPIATGHEREELEGKKRFGMDAPVGPFGTKEAPAVVQSYYEKRMWAALMEKPRMNMMFGFGWKRASQTSGPVCSQYFVLEVIGEGGPPEGHGVDDH